MFFLDLLTLAAPAIKDPTVTSVNIASTFAWRCSTLHFYLGGQRSFRLEGILTIPPATCGMKSGPP